MRNNTTLNVYPEVGRTPSWGDLGLGHGEMISEWGVKMDKMWMTKMGEDI